MMAIGCYEAVPLPSFPLVYQFKCCWADYPRSGQTDYKKDLRQKQFLAVQMIRVPPLDLLHGWQGIIDN